MGNQNFWITLLAAMLEKNNLLELISCVTQIENELVAASQTETFYALLKSSSTHEVEMRKKHFTTCIHKILVNNKE